MEEAYVTSYVNGDKSPIITWLLSINSWRLAPRSKYILPYNELSWFLISKIFKSELCLIVYKMIIVLASYIEFLIIRLLGFSILSCSLFKIISAKRLPIKLKSVEIVVIPPSTISLSKVSL